MKRREWNIGLMLVVLLVSLLVVPLAGPVVGAQPRVGVLFADEGDEDEDDGGTPGKMAIYWLGNNIYGAEFPDAAAQDVLDRGFTHVFNTPQLLDENREEWLSTKGFKVIQNITPRQTRLAITPRFSSPYEEPAAYAEGLADLEAHLLSRSDYLVGILDDIEVSLWPTRAYWANGVERHYPDKEFMTRSPEDIEERIGPAAAGSSWRTFKDHPSDGYHDVPDLTMENIEFNFPKPSTSYQVVNSRLNLGYFPPTGQQVGKIAQTFRPEHDRITRIDILMARHGDGAPGFPPGHVYFYLLETTEDANGIPVPDASKERLFPVDLRFEPNEVDHDPGEDFAGITPLSLYFDPEEHGVLDTTKTYALVLHYRGLSSPWTEDSVWYVLAADQYGGYGDGACFTGWGENNWKAFGGTGSEGIDIWFQVYYPDPPDGWGLRQFHQDWVDFQTDAMKWHVEDYRRILDSVNASKGTSLELYVFSSYSGELRDYLDRRIGNQHGEFTSSAFYSADWAKLASAGLDYAVCGYRYQDASMTLADLAGRAELIGGAQDQDVFNFRWWQGNKKALLWYYGSYEADPKVVVPRGRSPKSIP